ncbi:MAG: dienelactone hydrolase family protein [Terriglobales bacterium]
MAPEEITADLDAAADWALRQPASNGKLYVVGFCWGGNQSFRYATHRHDLSAALVFYGTPPQEAAMRQITAPVYGFYAGNDARVSLTVPGTRKLMKELHKRYHAVIYKGAGHGFMRAGEQPQPTAANREARDAGWKEIRKIIKR